MSVAVLIPVLDRPQRVRPLLDSLQAVTRVNDGAGPVGRPLTVPMFLCNHGDTAQIEAVRKEGLEPVIVPWPATRGDYARKMNHGLRLAAANGDEWAFLAADDLAFKPGWLESALKCHADTRACVIGTNDLGNPRVTGGQHSTHTLIHLAYLECGTIDEPDVVLHEGYWHNFVDQELVETAIARETWAVAASSHVEHLHPHWGKAQRDPTYEKGQAHFEDDRALFNQRRVLWGGP